MPTKMIRDREPGEWEGWLWAKTATSAGSYLDQPFVLWSPVRPPVHLPSACWTALGGLPCFAFSALYSHTALFLSPECKS